jgi:uncharacterized protein (TIGR00296 family)
MYGLQSALSDSRFPPITATELPKLNCSVSLLTDFEHVDSWDDWEIGEHGIRIRWAAEGQEKYATSTFLPEVPHQQGWDRLQTMSELVQKAGYRFDKTLLDDLEVTRYKSSKASAEYSEFLQSLLK